MGMKQFFLLFIEILLILAADRSFQLYLDDGISLKEEQD
jgi:hypothetical protein